MTTENATVNDPNKNDVGEVKPNPAPLDIGDKGEAGDKVPEADKAKAPGADEGGVEYEPTGDVGLDMALQFVGKAGIGSDHPAMRAAAEGNFDILRATLAAKGVSGWEQFVALGEKAYAANKASSAERQAKDQAAVYAAAGGEEQWKAIREWAAANADDQERKDINAQLAAGGTAAKMAAAYLANLYSKAANVNEDGREVNRDGSRMPAANANGALSPKDYAKAVADLNVTLKGRIEGTKEYEALQRRRAAYRG